MEAAKANTLPNLLYCQNESSESGKISILSETGSLKFYLLYSLTLLNINVLNIYYKYHHSTKLYQKISRVCCRLYCYECAGIARYYGDNDFYRTNLQFHCMFRGSTCDLQYLTIPNTAVCFKALI